MSIYLSILKIILISIYLSSVHVKDENTIFVVYCSGAGCSLSEELGFLMFDRYNLKKILLFEGGMPEWINEKLPTE